MKTTSHVKYVAVNTLWYEARIEAFVFSSRRRHTRYWRDWSSDVCSSDLINFGWGIGVFAGVYAGASSGAHLNPAVTLGLAVSGADEYAPGVPITLASSLVYVVAQMIGAFLGAVVAWLAYRRHYDEATEPVLGTFSTGPALKSPVDKIMTEVVGTLDRKSTRLNSSHANISYAVFCLKKKNK